MSEIGKMEEIERGRNGGQSTEQGDRVKEKANERINSKIQMRMLSHSEGLGILILTKDAFWPHVDVC